MTNLVLSRTPSPLPPTYLLPSEPSLGPQQLLDWVAIPDLASHDVRDIEERWRIRVPDNEQAQAEQLIQAQQFQQWLVSPRSSQLLVHGNYDSNRLISGLSLFCISFAQALDERNPQFLTLKFFCGLHEDASWDSHTGGRAIVQSFICQLLCQYDFSAAQLPPVNQESVRNGDIEHLCWVFKDLIRLLPNSLVVVCIIDGILYYERPSFLKEMGMVLISIMQMSQQTSGAALKLLITSPTGTTETRQPFSDGQILSMDAMVQPGLVASRSRLERELFEGFESSK